MGICSAPPQLAYSFGPKTKATSDNLFREFMLIQDRITVLEHQVNMLTHQNNWVFNKLTRMERSHAEAIQKVLNDSIQKAVQEALQDDDEEEDEDQEGDDDDDDDKDDEETTKKRKKGKAKELTESEAAAVSNPVRVSFEYLGGD
jgi:hypothetical protein